MSDLSLHGAIMRALADNPHVHADEISVQVDGDDVVLRGTVGSLVQQAEAMGAARGVPGAHSVVDELQVRPLGIDGQANADTEATVLDALLDDDDLAPEGLVVESRGGAVTLRGSLDLGAQRETAERIALAVPGVASVENRLSVRRTVPAGDVAERVTAAPLAGTDDRFGAEAAAAQLAERLERVPPGAVRLAADGRALLAPPADATRDRFDGPATASATLVVFGAHGTPASRPLGTLLERVREHHLVVWRHYPDPSAHPRAASFALAVEAAAAHGRFWVLTRELLRLRHDDPVDLHAAMVRAGLDPERAAEAMRAGTGADQIVGDVASARASGVAFSPTLFVNGERYRGELDPAAVLAALQPAR